MCESERGVGEVTGSEVTNDGDAVLRVWGQDAQDGRWAMFQVVIPWSRWESLNERLYNDREEIAQSRIPYE